MTPVVGHLTIDSAEPATLATWWSRVLGWHEIWRSDDGAEVAIGSRTGGSTNWLFNRVAGAKTVKNRLHVDLRPPEDHGTELARLLELGAVRVDIGQGDAPWAVLADPEGNEFCLLVNTPAEIEAYLLSSR
ncbi:VOC family protein [Cellulomonas sp.]|uniref:VOC family protein n=1 Tax=Cellulomonas sp. TaxID=40001 RepID=UPI003BAC280D